VSAGGETHCITCGDTAAELVVVELDSDAELAVCRSAGGEVETVDVALVAPVRLAERLLVHAGTAIGRGGVG
jgi:hypothetical protein